MYFNEVYKLKNQALATCDDESVQVIAAKDENLGVILLANMSDEDKLIELNVDGLQAKSVCVSTTTAEADDAKTQMDFNTALKVELKARAIMQIKMD